MATENLEVIDGADDANQLGSTVDISGSPELVDQATEFMGIRWITVSIEQGDTIDDMRFRFYLGSSSWDEPLHKIYGEDADASAAFTTASNDISGRTPTTAEDSWSQTDMGIADEELIEWGCTGGAVLSGHDLSAIGQEIVDRPGWANGNAITLIFTQPSSNAARDLGMHMFDEGFAAQLNITYTPGGAAEPDELIAMRSREAWSRP